MDEARGVRRVHVETMLTLISFDLDGQFMGHSGSSSPAHETTFPSIPEFGWRVSVKASAVDVFSLWLDGPRLSTADDFS